MCVGGGGVSGNRFPDIFSLLTIRARLGRPNTDQVWYDLELVMSRLSCWLFDMIDPDAFKTVSVP